MTGLIVSYDSARGYGWIKPLIGRPDEVGNVFVHRSQLRGCAALPKGAQVRFDLVRGGNGRGPQAANVKLVTLPVRSLYKRRETEDNAPTAA
ncbi:MAG: cold shock domain-containing protein [Acidobacteriota bacterium]